MKQLFATVLWNVIVFKTSFVASHGYDNYNYAHENYTAFPFYIPSQEHLALEEEIPEEMDSGFVGPYGLFMSSMISKKASNVASKSPQVSNLSSILEAEDAVRSNTYFYRSIQGYTGSGYLYFTIGPEAYVEWEVEGNDYFSLFFRYSNSRTSSRPMELSINGEEYAIVQFPGNGNRDFKYERPVVVYLPPGSNKIRLSATPDYVYIDHLLIEEYNINEAKTTMLATTAKFVSHVDGTSLLSKNEMLNELQVFFDNTLLLKMDCELLGGALELIEKYEEIYDPLFINSKTQDGFERDWSRDDSLELERSMLYIQQAIIDGPYQVELPYGTVEFPLQNCQEQLSGYKWETSNFFPGYVDLPSDSSIEYTIQINATMPPYWGMHACFADEPILRTTGLYLSPGGIAVVEVSSDLIGNGYKVQVGASTVDNARKTKHKRNDRVTSTYGIKGSSTYIASPLGGGIYIKVPYLAELGVVTVKITGDVVPAPIFAMTSIHSTSATEWNDNLRNSPAPWADFETDIFLMQVPTSWIKDYDYDHFKNLLEGNDEALTSVSELVGVPIEKRNKHVLYVQPDLHIKHGSYGVGYPQVNQDMKSGPDGPVAKPSHFFVAKPYLDWPTTWHELGHCIIRQNNYRGETEAIVNFPFTMVRNIHMEEDLDTAFALSFGYGRTKFTPDNAAIDWMVTPNFRDGKEMDYSNTQDDQFRYQERGYAKYADVVRLISWQTISDFNYNYNDNYDNPINNGLGKTDDRTLRLSIAAGIDLTPLIHFWGIHPDAESQLKNKMIEYDLPLSGKVYDLLKRYLTLIPMDNTEFIDYFKEVWPGKYQCNCGSPLYAWGWYNVWAEKYNESDGAKAVSAGNDIVDKYYVCEDTPGEFILDETNVNCAHLSTEQFNWACDHRQYTDLCPYSCGICIPVTSSPTKTPTPTNSPSKNPTSTPTMSLCKDNRKWKHVINGKKFNCGWVYRKGDKCNVKGQNGVLAKNACPIACRNKDKGCKIPKCLKSIAWSPNNKSFKNCKKIGKMKPGKKKQACALTGTDSLFGYEACQQCRPKRCNQVKV